MNPQEKAAVEQCSNEIVDAIVPLKVEELLSHLTNDTKVLHPDSADYLTTTRVFTRDTVHKTLNILKVNERGWYGLTSFLTKHNNAGLVAKLNKMAGKPEQPEDEIQSSSQEKKPTSQDIKSTPNVETKPEDKVKPNPPAVNVVPPFKEKLKSDPTPSNNRYKNERKGQALIINVNKFKDGRLREGSLKDFRNSEKLWGDQLGYELVPKYDLRGQEIMDVMEEFAADPDHEKADSVVVVVMSHGNYKEFEGKDGVKVNIQQFVDTLCKSEKLRGKPKLFLFQACRDEIDHDASSAEPEPTEQLIQERFAWFKQSECQSDESGINGISHAHAILGFATGRGQKAWRHREHGSFYIQAVCKVFADDFSSSHATQLLDTVEHKLSTITVRTESGGSLQQLATAHINNLEKNFYL